MDRKLKSLNNRGFSLLELLVSISMSAVLTSISYPSIVAVYGQMQASDDLRSLSYTISELRGEAIRLKTNIRIVFSSNGYSWDIGDNGSSEGSREFLPHTSWLDDEIPEDIVFNGLGVARGIGSEVTLSVENRRSELSFTVNSNGYISA